MKKHQVIWIMMFMQHVIVRYFKLIK
jgi:hypothetical protein